MSLHELVEAGLADGTLTQERGVWRSSGKRLANRRLSHIVKSRLDRLSDAERSVVEITALAGTVEVTVLERSNGMHPVMEAAGRAHHRRRGRPAAQPLAGVPSSFGHQGDQRTRLGHVEGLPCLCPFQVTNGALTQPTQLTHPHIPHPPKVTMWLPRLTLVAS